MRVCNFLLTHSRLNSIIGLKDDRMFSFLTILLQIPRMLHIKTIMARLNLISLRPRCANKPGRPRPIPVSGRVKTFIYLFFLIPPKWPNVIIIHDASAKHWARGLSRIYEKAEKWLVDREQI